MIEIKIINWSLKTPKVAVLAEMKPKLLEEGPLNCFAKSIRRLLLEIKQQLGRDLRHSEVSGLLRKRGNRGRSQRCQIYDFSLISAKTALPRSSLRVRA